MLLTGFDAPRLKKLYLDRLIKAHNLLQTLTRVNRTYKSYRYGYVVDFADIEREFDKTNRAYWDELSNELGDEIGSYSQLFKTAEEIEQEIADIKNALFDFDTKNAEEFCSQINRVEDKKQLLALKKALQTLLAAGFSTHTPWAQWPHLPIYLKAMTLRLEKYSGNPARDAAREADIQELEQMWQEKTDSLIKQGLPISDDLAAFKWMIEELRVSLFAQELKTPYPVSVKRLMKEWEGL